MSSWYNCVCCGENELIAKLKQKQSKRAIKQTLLDEKLQTNKPTEATKKWSKDISIIIIGAGHAGIHMALLLLQSGYNNVKILERKGKLGGRLLSIKDKALGTVDEMGTCYIYRNNNELMKLIDTFDKDNELIQINENTEVNIIDESCDEKLVCIGVKDWMHTQTNQLCSSKISQWFPSTNVAKQSVANTNIKLIYKKLYEDIFGADYANNKEITIPPKPDSNKMQLINMSILDFLCTNGLQSLIPHFIYTLSFNGYGNLNEIPAFYGLWYNKPNTLFIDRTVYILRHGIYSLFRNLVKKSNINIIHNVGLKSIDRHMNDQNKRIEINYCLRENKREVIECDILFIACDMTAIRTANEEKEIFDNMDTFSLCCTLFECDINSKVNEESKAIQIWSDKLLKCDSHLYLMRNSSKLILKDDYNKVCKHNNLKKEKFVSYQFSNKSRRNGSGEIFRKILLDDLKELNKGNVKILKQRVMRYFPKFKQFGINQYYPWKIQNELQGKHKNTFYIGKSTCFDSIEYELKYNIQLKQRLNL